MGLFDNLFKENTINQISNKQEAFLGILLATAAADGDIADEEVNQITIPINRMKLFASASGDDVKKMVEKILKNLKKDGPDAVMDKCVQALPKELHGTVFAWACEVVLADGVVENEEKTMLEKLQKKLELPASEAKEIVRVMIIKNRG